jgi:hypothetical protein
VLAILKAANRRRRRAGYGQLATDLVPRMRPVRSVFAAGEAADQAA